VTKAKPSGLRFFEKNRLVYCIIIVFAFLLYGNTISHNYSLDDDLITSTDRHKHPLVEQGISGLIPILKSNYAVNQEQNYDYRPISTYSYAIEWTLFGESENHVHISHFINVVLYSLIGLVLFQFLNLLFGKGHELFNLLITLLFLAHPMHTEVVNSLKNRDELLSLLFALLATIQTLKFIDKKHFLFLISASLLLLLSILSKKSSMPFIVLIPLTIYFFRSVSWKKIGGLALLLFSARIIVSIMKISLIEKSKERDFLFIENPLFEASFWERIPSYFYTNYLYLEKFIFPYDLNYYYGFNTLPIVGYSNLWFFIAFAIFAILFAYAIWTFKEKSILSYSILFFFLSIGGAANLLYPMVGIFAERLAFCGSIGLCILLTAGIFKLFKLNLNDKLTREKSKKIYLSFGAILLIMSTLTIQRNPAWKDKMSLYLADAQSLKKSAKANSLLGQELQYQAAKKFSTDPTNLKNFLPTIDSAYLYYDLALRTYPKYIQIYNNKAAIKSQYYQDLIGAREFLEKALIIDPAYQEGIENLIANEIRYGNMLDRLETVLPDKNPDPNKKTISSKAKDNHSTIQALSLIVNFETIGKNILRNGLNQLSINFLVSYAKQLETINNELRQISFSATVSSELNALFSGTKKSGQNILDPIIKNILAKKPDLFSSNSSLIIEKNKSNQIIEKQLIKLYNLNINNNKYYELASQYYIKNKAFESLIKLQFLQIKNFPNEFHAKQFIQIANAHYALKNTTKAKINFEKGMNELIKEKNELNQKADPSQNDLDRIIQINAEINKLTNYILELKKPIQKGGGEKN
jgi:protein O-mannosyl-transferase